MTIYSLDVFLFLFGTSLLFHVQLLTVASWAAYRFLKRQVRWSGIPTSFRIFRSEEGVIPPKLTWDSLDPQSSTNQGLVLQKTLFPWTGGQGMVSSWFKCITLIVDFISNLMPPSIWQEVLAQRLGTSDLDKAIYHQACHAGGSWWCSGCVWIQMDPI